MKAIVLREFGPPEVMRYEDVAEPEPRKGEIRIRILASTVNRVLDVSVRAGHERHRGIVLPLIPGVDCAGVVDKVGPGVTGWLTGMRVAAAGMMPLDACITIEDYRGPFGMMGINRPGGFAEKVTVPAAVAVEIPSDIDFHHAAVVMRHVPTAWNLLVNVAELKGSETVLIMGAGGNLGTLGIQIAKNVVGAKVIAAAGSDDRARLAKSLGADYAVNYNSQDLYAEIMGITGGKGVDVLYDNVANPKVLPAAFRAIGSNGRLVTAGAHAGPVVPIDFSHLYQKSISIRGRPGYSRADIPKIFAAAAAGKVQAVIEQVLPLSRAADAHHLMETQEVLGKIVLDPTLK
ncbi:zinc-binding dehydrogenase [Bradyrhizobium sp. DASA03007]|uniref:zinc-binding dehydrogenase n=1 Tax=unclassified Bradyrhizobium TaxID=2631580 RepID=UPI003F728358